MESGDNLEKIVQGQPKSWFRKYFIEDMPITDPRTIRRVYAAGALFLITMQGLMVIYVGPPNEPRGYYLYGLMVLSIVAFLYGAY